MLAEPVGLATEKGQADLRVAWTFCTELPVAEVPTQILRHQVAFAVVRVVAAAVTAVAALRVLTAKGTTAEVVSQAGLTRIVPAAAEVGVARQGVTEQQDSAEMAGQVRRRP